MSADRPAKEEGTPAWQRALQEHTGQWAFVLSLSRRMVFVLQQVRDGEDGRCFTEGLPTVLGPRSGQWIPSANTVIARGLVQYEQRKNDTPRGAAYKNLYTLTPAGELVCGLLVLAGLMPAAEKKQKRRAA